MQWPGPIKSVSIRLPESLHLAVKSKAPSSSAKTLENAYQEALEAWLERPAKPQPTGEILECPRHLIKIVRNVIADLSDPAEYEAILQEGIRAKMKERGHGIAKVK